MKRHPAMPCPKDCVKDEQKKREMTSFADAIDLSLY